MSTPNSGGAQDLTGEEYILHHHASVIKKDLEVYRTYPRSQEDWGNLFKTSLVRFILITHFYKPFSDLSRRIQ
jgi:hypothetical protein